MLNASFNCVNYTENFYFSNYDFPTIVLHLLIIKKAESLHNSLPFDFSLYLRTPPLDHAVDIIQPHDLAGKWVDQYGDIPQSIQSIIGRCSDNQPLPV